MPKLIESPGDVVLAVASGHDQQRSPSDTLRRDAELDRLAVIDERAESDQDRRLLGFSLLHTVRLIANAQETSSQPGEPRSVQLPELNRSGRTRR